MINNILENSKNIISFILDAIFSAILDAISDLLSYLKENTVQKILPIGMLLVYLFFNLYNFFSYINNQNSELYILLFANLVTIGISYCSDQIPIFVDLISTVVDDSLVSYYDAMRIVFIGLSVVFLILSAGTILLEIASLSNPLMEMLNLVNQI